MESPETPLIALQNEMPSTMSMDRYESPTHMNDSLQLDLSLVKIEASFTEETHANEVPTQETNVSDVTQNSMLFEQTNTTETNADTKLDLSLIKTEMCLEELQPVLIPTIPNEKTKQVQTPAIPNKDWDLDPDQLENGMMAEETVTIQTESGNEDIKPDPNQLENGKFSEGTVTIEDIVEIEANDCRTNILVPIQGNPSNVSNAMECEYCGKVFKHKTNLSRHYRIHTGEQPFSCIICKRRFRRKTSLQTHFNNHSNNKKYQCKLCKKTFLEGNDLEKHHRVHTGEKPHKCQFCQKSFSQKGNLERHLRLHTGEKPYKCEVCPAAFPEQTELRRHLRKHTGEKPYKCLVCFKTYSKKTYLTKHSTTHSGGKVKRRKTSKRRKKASVAGSGRVNRLKWHSPCP